MPIAKRARQAPILTLALLSFGALLQPAVAATQTLFFDTLNVSTSVSPSLNAGDTLFVDTLVRSQTGLLSQDVTFSVGEGVNALTGQAAWAVSTATGAGPRLIGVSFDLFNASNALVTTDTFQGVASGFAFSTFSFAGLAPGSYMLRATGTAVRDTLFDLALSFTGTPPASQNAGTGALPAQPSTTNEATAFFSQLTDTRTLATAFGAGDSLIVDTLVTSEAGDLAQIVAFTLDEGVNSLVADIAWMVSTAAGPGPRLVAFNVDLMDSANTVLMSDSFGGVLAGSAHSTLSGAIGPGSYRLLITGSGVRDSSFDIAMSFAGTPDMNDVPEPASISLVFFGLASVAWSQRRRGVKADLMASA